MFFVPTLLDMPVCPTYEFFQVLHFSLYILLEFIFFCSIHICSKSSQKVSIMKHMSNIHKYLEFKTSEEENNNINYLDFSIHRNCNNLNLGICRKPKQNYTIVHFTSNHSLEHKLAAFTLYINRMITVQITEKTKQQERNY